MIISKAASQPATSKCVLVELPRVVGDTSFEGDAGVIGRVVSISSAPDGCLDLKGNTHTNMPSAIMWQQNSRHQWLRCGSLNMRSASAESTCMHACRMLGVQWPQWACPVTEKEECICRRDVQHGACASRDNPADAQREDHRHVMPLLRMERLALASTSSSVWLAPQ